MRAGAHDRVRAPALGAVLDAQQRLAAAVAVREAQPVYEGRDRVDAPRPHAAAERLERQVDERRVPQPSLGDALHDAAQRGVQSAPSCPNDLGSRIWGQNRVSAPGKE